MTARPFKRAGLHKLVCRDCGGYVYAAVAQLERHGLPVCPECGEAYDADELELALLLGLDDSPIVAAWRDLTARKELSQCRSVGWEHAAERHASGTLNRMDTRAADEMRAERRERARSNRLQALRPAAEAMPF
jgi:hypothetical protein